MAAWRTFIEWAATNIGPAIPFIFSGAFSVWALVLKMRSDAARRADELAREVREEARRKQEKADREADALRLENERVKTAAYEKAEKLLNQERERNQELLDEKIKNIHGELEIAEHQLELLRQRAERDAATIENLRAQLQRRPK